MIGFMSHKRFPCLIVAVLVFLSVLNIGCGNKERDGHVVNGSPDSAIASDRDTDDSPLFYMPSNRYWTKQGTELVVEGSILNLSSDYDVIELRNAVIYINDLDGNTLASCNVNEDYVGAIAHNGSIVYNFTIDDIPGGGASYRASGMIPVLVTDYVLADHLRVDCPHCNNETTEYVSGSDEIVPDRTVCTHCNGVGLVTCPDCKGTGKLDENIKGVLRAFEHGRCVLCEGEGKVYCSWCNGQGYY